MLLIWFRIIPKKSKNVSTYLFFFFNWFPYLYISVVKFSPWLIPRSPFSLGESHCLWKLSSVVMLGRKFFSEDPESCCLWPKGATSEVEIWKLFWRLKRSWCFYLVNPLYTVKMTVNLVTIFLHGHLNFQNGYHLNGRFFKITIFEIPKINSGKQPNIGLESFFSTRSPSELPASCPVLTLSL